MPEISDNRKSLGVYLLILWMALNIALLILSIATGDYVDLNNWIETVLFAASIVGLWVNKRSGYALAVSVLCITLGTSMGNVLLGYYLNYGLATFVVLNALRVVVNAAAAVYLFKRLFAGKFS